MSSGYTSPDKKLVSFEINHGLVQGRFTLAHLDGDELNPDRILLKLHTQSNGNRTDQQECMTSVIIKKDYTRVLSHMFRHMADLMDEWYEEA